MVLHKLAAVLLEQGFDAWLRPDTPGHWQTNPLLHTQVTYESQPDDVVIYHTSINGNPWGASRIIRWMLYRWEPQEGVPLFYSPQFGPGPHLNIIDPRLDLFHDRQESRHGTCWAWRKADWKDQGWRAEQKPRGGTEIPRGLSLVELADLFNRHENFISYDGASWLAVQAALCGCDSIVPRPVGAAFPYPGIARHERELVAKRQERPELRQLLAEREREQGPEAARVIREILVQQGWQT
jgi:hypothetical protein